MSISSDKCARQNGNPAPTSARANNVSTLRLLFAVLVIVSHSPELIDGNRSREVLTRVFHTLSFGEVGVHGFFLISGYLITMSFSRSHSLASYATKRIARIVPGYLVAFALCFFVLSPLVGGENTFNLLGLRHFVSQTSRLLPPYTIGTFPDLKYPALNGSMWTIAYEARCYLAVAFAGLLGAFSGRGRYALVGLCLAGIAITTKGVDPSWQPAHLEAILGQPYHMIRFLSVFTVGSLFYLFGDRVHLSHSGALIAAALLFLALFYSGLANAAFAVFGGYLIFWFAFAIKPLRMSALASKTDISYGLYLYAWPVQNSLILSFREINPWLLCGCTVLIAGAAGYISWTLIEAPALRVAHKRASRHVPLMQAERIRGSHGRERDVI